MCVCSAEVCGSLAVESIYVQGIYQHFNQFLFNV